MFPPAAADRHVAAKGHLAKRIAAAAAAAGRPLDGFTFPANRVGSSLRAWWAERGGGGEPPKLKELLFREPVFSAEFPRQAMGQVSLVVAALESGAQWVAAAALLTAWFEGSRACCAC